MRLATVLITHYGNGVPLRTLESRCVFLRDPRLVVRILVLRYRRGAEVTIFAYWQRENDFFTCVCLDLDEGVV